LKAVEQFVHSFVEGENRLHKPILAKNDLHTRAAGELGKPENDGSLRTFIAKEFNLDTRKQGALSNLHSSAGNFLGEILNEQGTEMGRLAAARKLLKLNPETLLISTISTIQDLERANNNIPTPESNQLRKNLENYGVKKETLETALKAQTDKEYSQAAGLLSKEISFLN
jgi:hypothetical protein